MSVAAAKTMAITLAEAPTWVEKNRKTFSKVYIATTEPRRWKIETDEEE